MLELEDVVLGSADAEEVFIPRSKFAGSLEYIDSLEDRLPVLSINKSDLLAARDAYAIANADQEDIIPALPADNRFYRPRSYYQPGELIPGAAVLRDDWVPWIDPDRSSRRYRVNTETGEIRYSPRVRYKDLSRPSFRAPQFVWNCVRRKMRREVMHALGFAGRHYIPRRFNMWSRVLC